MTAPPAEMLAVVLATPGGGGLRPLAGKPMLAFTCETARTCRRAFRRLVVATGDSRVSEMAGYFGIETPALLPPELGGAEAAAAAALRHTVGAAEAALRQRFDWICILRDRFPLRTAEDLERGIALARQGGGDTVAGVVAVPHLHPLFFRRIHEGWTVPYTAAEPDGLRPQDARPIPYLPTEAIRLCRRDLLMEWGALEGSAIQPLPMSEENALEAVDLDLVIAERLLKKRIAAAARTEARPGAPARSA